MSFQCPRCGNTDQKYIGYFNGQAYCRKCISFNGEKVGVSEREKGLVSLHLKYSLSQKQDEISKQLLENYKNHINSLVNAVCGAGKTEIVFRVISYALSHGKRVGFAIPRRDVVIELYVRLKNVFHENEVVAVYGGSTSRLEGDIVVLTTHQLYRYEKYFDLLILDEIDAFPFKGNNVLYQMFHNAAKDVTILMSATPSEEVLKEYKSEGKMMLELNSRFHKYPLPVPEFVTLLPYFKERFVIKTLKEFIKNKKPTLVFAPTIDECETLFEKIKQRVSDGFYVHSRLSNRSEIINKFRKYKYKFLVTTAVLERGVTLKDLQVIVFNADNHLYDEHALVQIAGRVGRKSDAPEGRVIFVSTKVTEEMEKARDTIKSKNQLL